MSTPSTVVDFAPRVPVSLYTRIRFIVEQIYSILIPENPLLWYFLSGRKNPQADMAGPYFLSNAPNRNVADGKVVIATLSHLKASAPFLLTLSVKDPKGNPIPHAVLDWWQADQDGNYAFMTYGMRGTCVTDASGYVEVLSVVPGKYGPANHKRASHFHITIRDPEDKWGKLTTQVYICPKNDPNDMGSDFLNFYRFPRRQNMVKAWCIPTAYGGNLYREFPSLPQDDVAHTKVEWWNKVLVERDRDIRVVAGGYMGYTLNERHWL